MVGTWEAQGGGEPGRSTGTFSFQWAAGGYALLRQNSEGHVIDYSATVLETAPKVVFESVGSGPRYRLWYEVQSDSTLATGFQVAAPGGREFKTYLKGVAHRKREKE